MVYRRKVITVLPSIQSERTAQFVLITAAVLWGVNAVATKLVVTEMPPITAAALRFFLIGLFMLLIITGRKRHVEHRWPSREEWFFLFLLGVSGIFLNSLMYYLGLRMSTATNAALFSAISPVFTAFIGYLFYREDIHRNQLIGLAVSLSGVAILISKGSIDALVNLRFGLGDLFLLTCPFSWAIYTVVSRRLVKTLGPMAVTAYAALIGSLLLIPFAIFEEDKEAIFFASGQAWWLMGFMVVFSGLIAFTFWNEGVARLGPTRTAVFQNAVPVFGVLGGALILHEPFQRAEILGAAMVLFGTFSASYVDPKTMVDRA